MQFSNRMDRLEENFYFVLRERIEELEAQGRKVYDFATITPDSKIPPHLKRALLDSASNQKNWKYSKGDSPELLDAVITYYKKRYSVTITRDMIFGFRGNHVAIINLCMILCNEGDTVILPSPYRPVMIAGVNTTGAKPFFYKSSYETEFLPVLSEIPEKIAKAAKFMIISNPCNSFKNDLAMKEIIEFAKENDILLIHDNSYSDLVFEGTEGGSFLHINGASEVGVELFSLEESFNLAEARIGFCIGRPDVIAASKKLHRQFVSGLFYPLQEVAIAALMGPTDMIKRQHMKYKKRLNRLCDGLNSIGWEFERPRRSLFLWAPIPSGYKSSMKFCTDLMDKAGVICVPGINFGPYGEGYVRFSLMLPPEEIDEAVEAIRKSGVIRK